MTWTETDNSGYGEHLAATVCSLPLVSNMGAFQHTLLQTSDPTSSEQFSLLQSSRVDSDWKMKLSKAVKSY